MWDQLILVHPHIQKNQVFDLRFVGLISPHIINEFSIEVFLKSSEYL